MFVGLDLGKQTTCFHIGNNGLACLKAIEPVVLGNRGIRIGPFAGAGVCTKLICVDHHIG